MMNQMYDLIEHIFCVVNGTIDISLYINIFGSKHYLASQRAGSGKD